MTMTVDKLFRPVWPVFFYFILSLKKYLLSGTVLSTGNTLRGWGTGSVPALLELRSSKTMLYSAKRMDFQTRSSLLSVLGLGTSHGDWEAGLCPEVTE